MKTPSSSPPGSASRRRISIACKSCCTTSSRRRPTVRHSHALLVAALGFWSASCSSNPANTEPQPVAASARGNLRFKGPERLNADVAQALELPATEVCKELGLYACTTVVHNVALGGVEPYGAGLYEASGITSATTPLVVDRVMWAAAASAPIWIWRTLPRRRSLPVCCSPAASCKTRWRRSTRRHHAGWCSERSCANPATPS